MARITYENFQKYQWKYRPDIGKEIYKDKEGYNWLYKEKCEYCKQPFLAAKTKSKFCSKSCNMLYYRINRKGRRHSPEAIEAIRQKAIQRQRNPEDNPRWDGGYNSNGIPKYDTYAHQLEWCEEVRRNEKDPIVLEVRCAYNKCRKWYIPTLNNVSNRIQAINGKKRGEHRFYCSEKCKDKCPIYGMRPEYLINRDRNKFNGIINCMSSTHELSIWKKEVLKRVGNQCEMCGSIKNINVHHEYPQKTHQIFSLDPDNGIVLCKKCHYKYGHSKNTSCSTGKLAMI